MEPRTTLSLQTHYLEKLEGRQTTDPSHSHPTAKSTAVDPKPSSNHADKLAARVVTRGFPWQATASPGMAKIRQPVRRGEVIE